MMKVWPIAVHSHDPSTDICSLASSSELRGNDEFSNSKDIKCFELSCITRILFTYGIKLELTRRKEVSSGAKCGVHGVSRKNDRGMLSNIKRRCAKFGEQALKKVKKESPFMTSTKIPFRVLYDSTNNPTNLSTPPKSTIKASLTQYEKTHPTKLPLHQHHTSTPQWIQV
jgi:hypothetical protein